MINRLQKRLAKLALNQLDGIVLNHVRNHPGQRCFEIDRATINSHHQWGTKHILQRLERQGKIYCIKREYVGTMHEPGKPPEVVFKKVPPTYFTYTN